MNYAFSVIEKPDWWKDAVFEAAHAWALELDELDPLARKIVLHIHEDAQRRLTNRLIYGVEEPPDALLRLAAPYARGSRDPSGAGP